ncbi:MAG: hypothetical protein KF784_15630 [Fimbriimonadaceae bacterium]|nr:hypothetical protein [Fimbriimonadaceae bacterium]
MRTSSTTFVIVSLAALSFVAGCQQKRVVGELSPTASLVPTDQIVRPAGTNLVVNGRPIDGVLSRDGKRFFAKDSRGLIVVDIVEKKVIQELSISGGTSLHGIAEAPDGSVWLTDAGNDLEQAVLENGKYVWKRKVTFPAAPVGGASYPCGFTFSGDGSKAFVCLSRSNQLAIVNLGDGKIESQFDVDIAPFDVAVSSDGKTAWVSCWGGQRPKPGVMTQKSAGTEVEIDFRGVTKEATVVQVDLTSKTIKKHTPVGLQPNQVLLDERGKRVFVACANEDTVAILDSTTGNVKQKLNIKPDPKLLFGSMPNALALSPDGRTLYVANGGNNAIAVVDLASGKPKGFIPTAWYPSGVVLAGDSIVVTNAKGTGSRSPRRMNEFNTHGHTGSINIAKLPDAAQLAAWTKQSLDDAGVPQALLAAERSQRKGTPKPVPNKPGEASTIEHVVYIIKENRTYDQVFGDMPQGDGEPSLCSFPREVSPNHHALAEQFVLLDNYYCNGILSADGHSWAMEGYASSYLEKSFGGWTRSYPFGGDDPLNVAATGFLWDHVLANGMSVLNFGEFDYATSDPKGTWKEIYDDFVAGKNSYKYPKNISVERIRAYSDPDFPGWNMGIPDVVRADIFLKKFKAMKTMPNLTVIYLPEDHGSGGSAGMPTPRAHMADNDLAMGQIVEALTNSPYWSKMAIFINEDDPQNGWDHIDGHRSLCLVVSPYTKRKAVNSTFYNQTSVLHTMCLMLGITPMTQFVALSDPMRDVFTDKPDLTPFKCLPNNIPLDELNPRREEMTPEMQKLADISAKIDFSLPDRADENTLNRLVWRLTMGTKPYPTDWVGPHGRGLKSKGLKLDKNAVDEDDD